MNSDCNNLDPYLGADLPADDAARFAEHLECCDDCRDAVDQQRWIDRLLYSSANYESELPPDDVLVTLRTSIAWHHQRTKRFACGLAAAAALVVATGWTVLSRQAADWTNDRSIQPGLATTEKSSTMQPPRATFVSDSSAIAVPMKSRHPDVTVVRIYPAYLPRYENQTAALEPEAATNESWQIFSNGG